MSQFEPELTNHALLVLWGQFARQIGLVAALEAVPLHQKAYTHKPQTKVLEFLIAILGGLSHLKDLNRAAHPIARDPTVARAWGQPAWADYSGVSRTLAALTMAEAGCIVQALDAVSRPFIDQEIQLALLRGESLIWDGDLTGRPVSNNSTTYPNVAYGHMSDGVHLGYQAAMVSMHSPTYGRLWLSTTAHPGDTVASTRAEALVQAAEARSCVRPRRRTDLLRQRLQQAEMALRAARKRVEQAEQALAVARQQLTATQQQLAQWQTRVQALEAEYQTRKRRVRPQSKLAQARRRLDVQERRLPKREKALLRAERRLERQQTKLQSVLAPVTALTERLRRFEQDNRANPHPVMIILRLDAGFGTPENVALLIEMGYELYTKPQSHWVTAKLQASHAGATGWERVGANAEMIAWPDMALARYPYPLDVALERFYTGDKLKHSTLLHFSDQSVTDNLPGWFQRYNARQTIEAGIKEGKGIFKMHHLKVRSQPGLFLQEQFAAFAANFVRWVGHWLHEQAPAANGATAPETLANVKTMVQVTAHTSAWVLWQPHGCLLRFTDRSVFAGQSLQIQEWYYQLPLPIFNNHVFAPP